MFASGAMREAGDEQRPGDPPGPAIIPVSEVLRESEERYRALAENARDAIVEISPDAGYLYVSPSFTELFGWRPEEVLGANALAFVHPDDFTEIDAIRATAFAAESAARVVCRFRHSDGSYVWVEVTGRPYRTRAGELRAVLISRDVSDRVLAEQTLQAQLESERKIAELSRRLLQVRSSDFESCLRHGLEVAAEVANAERAQIYVARPPRGDRLEVFLRWLAPGMSELVDGPVSTVAGERFRWAGSRLVAGEIVHVPRVAALPPEAAEERAAFEQRGLQSYLGIPIADGSRTLGFIDFARMSEARGWSHPEVARLRLIAEVLGAAVRRIHAEGERRAAEERLRTLTSHTRDTICEIALDGRVTFISDNFEQLCGYSASEMEGVEPWSLIHPEDIGALRREAAGAASAGASKLVSFRVRHRDGRWRWLEATLNPFVSRGEKRMAAVVRDVTDRHEQRLELESRLATEKRVAEFSRTLLDSGAEGMDAAILKGLEAAAALAGAERAFLVSGKGRSSVQEWQAPGVPPRPRFEPDDARDTWIRAILERGEVVRIPRVEDLPEAASEARRTLLEIGVRSYLCLPISSGRRLIGVVGFHCFSRRDWSDREINLLRVVTDLFGTALRRKRAETRLADSQLRLLQAQKMEAVGTLAGGIAHDFNNQLTVMLASARFALEQSGVDEEVRQALLDLSRAAEHCAQLTRSLLAFSRRNPASPRALDPRSVVAEAEELLRPLIPSSIRLEVQLASESPRIVADPIQLQQVLVNLVVNARDAMPGGGLLSVCARPCSVSEYEAYRLGLREPGEYVEFVVRDTGAGMSDEVRRRIFEPFFTTKPVGHGTGLGLATAYGIVEQCGGAIAVDSRLGHGSTFRVLLPRSGEIEAEDVPAAAPAVRHGAGTVLLVEDEASVRRLVARMLRDAGYEVIEAPDGAEALRLGRQQIERVTALVTDLDMPRLSGVDLARRLARQRPDLPVLFISGLAPQSADAMPSGSGFLGKPFTREGLLEHLDRLIRPR
jgi:PAS domain S-box-containing protein